MTSIDFIGIARAVAYHFDLHDTHPLVNEYAASAAITFADGRDYTLPAEHVAANQPVIMDREAFTATVDVIG